MAISMEAKVNISVRYVNSPKPGGKYGNLKTVSGEVIMCPPDLLDQFQAGQTYDVAIKQQTWGQGTDQERLVTIVASGPTGAVQGQGGQAGYQPPAQGSASYRGNTGFQPRVVQGGSGGPVGMPSGADQARQIFVTGCVGRALGSGKFAASEIAVLTSEANRAFDLIGKPKPVQNTFPSDPLPPGMEPGDPGPELQ
jgi:hypothetical protein